jgi:hypothetical protein
MDGKAEDFPKEEQAVFVTVKNQEELFSNGFVKYCYHPKNLSYFYSIIY